MTAIYPLGVISLLGFCLFLCVVALAAWMEEK